MQVHTKPFATLVSDKKIKIRRRLFMTATERVYRGDREDVLNMESEKDYGARFFELSFKEAIKQRIITDYKILTMTVSDSHIRRYSASGASTAFASIGRHGVKQSEIA